ncbi:MAG: isocitrate lyase/phosphoenolpyruvate mutase family protein [Bacteroidetes bacterium]|nr:isocitrate lyase/phosphoenolpyruvate mutase family protein [Bacteroidota bacterium]
MNKYETFVQLHHQDKPVILANSWNVYSAKLAEINGYKAIATSSLAIAVSLGYEDGENIPFSELLFMVKKIIAGVSLPVSVDMEAGYSDNTAEIISNIDQLIDAGAVGINFEDAKKQHLVDDDAFSEKIKAIREHLNKTGRNLFINARTDGYLLKIPSPKAVTLGRIKKYEAAGANGIFVPFVSDINDIKEITSAVSLPVNVLSMPGLPSFDKLTKAGVRRISLGSSLFRAAYRHTETLIQNVNVQQSVQGLY